MRIGIITYPDIADGKGRFLQAYALYSYIEKLGYDVEIIDYEKLVDTSMIARLKRFASRVSLQEVAKYIYKCSSKKKMECIRNQRQEQREKYNEFINSNINVSRKIHDFGDLVKYSEGFDAFVCGSDQIWNPYFIGLDPVYYLQFVESKKRISYAASLGTVLLDREKEETICKWIRTIPYCSVREESAKWLLKKNGIDARNVLDPTFLMDSIWWNDFGNIPPKNQRPYLVSLYFDNSIEPRKLSSEICKKYALEELNIPETILDIKNYGVKKEACLSPKEFVSLFANAEYVVTQSFHGVVLSILFKKKFFVFNRTSKLYVDGVFSRIQDLLNKLGLAERIVSNISDWECLNQDIDYSEVDDKIALFANESRSFLQAALEKVCDKDIGLASKYSCTGCAVCADACPKNAIELREGDDGFTYPYIHFDLCVKCKKCLAVCPTLNKEKDRFKEINSAYICQTSNMKLLENSTSGAFFATVATNILSKKGLVVGCELSDNLQARHIVIKSVDEIPRIQKSKYVQSSTLGIFRTVRSLLEEGRMVLFSGTPCQVNGLLSFLSQEYPSLYTIDIVCHGVPSQSFFDKTIKYFEQESNRRVIYYSAREKRRMWSPQFQSCVCYDNGDIKWLEKHKGDVYKNAFINNLSLRRSCYNCEYACQKRVADITIADAWGIRETQLSGINHNNGVSMIAINSAKGKWLFENIKNDMTFETVEIDQFIKSQPALRDSANMNKKRDIFLEEVETNGITKKAMDLVGEDETKIKRCKHAIEHAIGEKRYTTITRMIKKVIYKNECDRM